MSFKRNRGGIYSNHIGYELYFLFKRSYFGINIKHICFIVSNLYNLKIDTTVQIEILEKKAIVENFFMYK
jgi:hypothetical protein